MSEGVRIQQHVDQRLHSFIRDWLSHIRRSQNPDVTSSVLEKRIQQDSLLVANGKDRRPEARRMGRFGRGVPTADRAECNCARNEKAGMSNDPDSHLSMSQRLS